MRGFLTAFSNIFSYVNQIWVSDAVWITAEALRSRPGFIWASVFSVVLISLSIILHSLEVRDGKKREAEEGDTRQVDIETAIQK
jgi:MFS transporter, ACS family, pantothenate transporter